MLPAGLVFTFDQAAFSWPVASVLQVVYAWGMSLGLIGLFRILIPRERRGVRYLSDSAYWLYVAHLPVVVIAQAIVRDWSLPAEAKFLLISVVVTATLLAELSVPSPLHPDRNDVERKESPPSARIGPTTGP